MGMRMVSEQFYFNYQKLHAVTMDVLLTSTLVEQQCILDEASFSASTILSPTSDLNDSDFNFTSSSYHPDESALTENSALDGSDDGIMSWTKSLTIIPKSLDIGKVEAYRTSKSAGNRNELRSHKFVAESYVQCSTIETRADTTNYSTLVHVRAKCFRSQKKTATPYTVSAALTHDGYVRECVCECAAGENGACHHVMGLLKVLVLLITNGYEEPPPELSCTELPQMWRRPRGQKIPASSVDDIDWRAARPEGVSNPLQSRLYEARKRPRSLEDVQEAAKQFAIEMAAHTKSSLLGHWKSTAPTKADSLFGDTCRQPLVEPETACAT
ncbi:hypothetical protein HPB50_020840 [Hyalomma asiaticum]|uniref:Uncharacterized protein n=1 Tax=Hyalomma asiaticum TaxID=266040 RepID=A0ACB7RV95_HYAAI|nr:hypothetical protein HPB50_020840 [Hyalomma asiaticum]